MDKTFGVNGQLFLLFLMLWVVACSTNGRGQSAKVIPAAPIPAEVRAQDESTADDFFLTSIGTTTLPGGTCGMILWTLDVSRPVPVLQYISGAAGEFRLNSVPYELIRTDAQGDGVFGIFSHQVFAAGTDIQVTVDIAFGQGFDGGTYLERGIIKVDKPGSPELVTPVAGLAGCRTS